MKKWMKLGLGTLAVGVCGVSCGLPYHTDTTYFTLKSKKVSERVRVCLLSDLHNDCANKRKDLLLEKIAKENVDLVLMPGDMVEERRHHANTYSFFERLVKIAPCFYSSGNHEQFRWDVTEVLDRIRKFGITVLDQDCVEMEVKGQHLVLAGLECRHEEEDFTSEEVQSMWHGEGLRILLSHRPHWVDLYAKSDADLVVCGHAHGGQWHIPLLGTPCAAPQQGIFPKYTEGLMDLDGVKMLVSRGLVRHYHGIPRLFNNPEIVILDIVPE